MKQILQIVFFICVATVANAQNKEIEAMATFEMAEEQFNAKNYIQALEYVTKTKTILGKPNSRILFLGIQILNELSKTDAQYLEDALSAILVFEKIADAEQYIEEKRIEIAKVKLDLHKRKNAYEKEANRTADLLKQYNEMVYRLAAEFPKTKISVSNFIASVPSTWGELRWGGTNNLKVTDKRIEKFIKSGGNDFNSTWEEGKFFLQKFKTHNIGEDRIKEYSIRKVLKYHSRQKNAKERDVTIGEICDILKITPQQWNDFTSGAKPLIRKDIDPDGYWVTLMLSEKGTDGEYKYFQMFLYRKTWGWTTEDIRIDIFENTF